LRLLVEDDGPGIPPGELEAVFQPFHRLEGSRNRETGGVGLGLPIARNILRAHGGDVVLRNRTNGGLSAEATLPGDGCGASFKSVAEVVESILHLPEA
jgi:signal transduction histidine kinase